MNLKLIAEVTTEKRKEKDWFKMDLKSLEEIREALLRLKNIPCGATVTTDSSMLALDAWDAILTARSSSEEGGSSSGISGMEFETESIRSEDKLTVADIKALFR